MAPERKRPQLRAEALRLEHEASRIPPKGQTGVQSHDDRKRAIDDYKNRTPHRGIFAVRCSATGQVWVGDSPNLDSARNRLWFMLRHGSSRNLELGAEWRAHGEEAFRFEVLEELDADISPLLVSGALKEKAREWAAKEQARILLP